MDYVLQYGLDAIFMLIVSIFGIAYRRQVTRFKENSRKQEAIEQGIQALLRDRIIQTYNHYMDRGYCPIYAMENLDSLYKQYHELGGNGTITELVERLKELPTEKE